MEAYTAPNWLTFLQRIERFLFRKRTQRIKEFNELKETVARLEQAMRLESVVRQRGFGSLERRLASKQFNEPPPPPAHAPEDNASASIEPIIKQFYFLLQERYRGSREEIKQRLLIYRDDIKLARNRTGVNGPIIDLGCGRGELLEILQEDGVRVVGIDSNDTQLDVARRHNLPVVCSEAMPYLRSLTTGSILGVVGIHIVEHIPFQDLLTLMREIARVLRPGGVVIFETPNPRNIIVGATTFHFDPTHIRPLPPEVLQLMLEVCGFGDIELRMLHPSGTLKHMLEGNKLDPYIASLLFGPQDYAAIGLVR